MNKNINLKNYKINSKNNKNKNSNNSNNRMISQTRTTKSFSG